MFKGTLILLQLLLLIQYLNVDLFVQGEQRVLSYIKEIFFQSAGWHMSSLSTCELNDLVVVKEKTSSNIQKVYKVFSSIDSSKAVLVKYGECEKEAAFLRYERMGIESFARYAPSLVQRIYHYDAESSFLVLEYLDSTRYKPLQELFIALPPIDTDAATFIGVFISSLSLFHVLLYSLLFLPLGIAQAPSWAAAMRKLFTSSYQLSNASAITATSPTAGNAMRSTRSSVAASTSCSCPPPAARNTAEAKKKT